MLLQVLKLPQNPDSQAIQRQYNKLKRENQGNEAAIARIENAHSALMMRNLSARLKVGTRLHTFSLHLRGTQTRRYLFVRVGVKWQKRSDLQTRHSISHGAPG